MDNVPKDQKQKTSAVNNTNEIFSGQPPAPSAPSGPSYNDVMRAELEPEGQPQPEQLVEQPQAPPPPPPQEPAGPSPAFPPGMAPPPFAEDNKKKIIIIVGIVLFLILLIFLLLRLLRRAPAEQPKPVEEAKITLTYWGLWEDESVNKVVLDDYQRLHPNITINYVKQDPKQYRERLQAAIDRGEGPDIFRYHNTWIPMFNKQLAPMPKTIYSDADFQKTFYPVVATDVKIGADYFGIPLEIDGLLLFYNEDILKSANVDVPKTWVDIQNALSKITVKQDERIVTSAIALGTAENIEHFSDVLGMMMLQNGTQLSKSLFSCVDTSTSTCGVEALTFYRKFSESPSAVWDDTLDNSIAAFAGSKVAMILAPSWQAVTLKQMNPELNFKTAAPPQLPCDRDPCPSVNWASYWIEGVSNKSKNAAAAWEVLKFLSQKDTQEKLFAEQAKVHQLFGEPYSRVDLNSKMKENTYLAALAEAAPSMKSFYVASRTNDGETGLNTSLIKYLQDAVNATIQNTSPETALKSADEGFKQVFQRFGLAQ